VPAFASAPKVHPVTRLINFCWFWFKWGLIACAIGAALAVPYFYQRMDNEIRCRVEDLFARHYTGLQVKIRSAALMKGEGISIRGLSIVDPAAEGPGGELLNYDECFIACPTDLSGLLSGELRPTRIVIRRPTLRMTRRGDGTWSAARLLPLPRFTDGAIPEVRVENGTIEVFDPTKSPPCTTTFRDVNLSFSPLPDLSKLGTAPPPGQPETTRRRRVQGTATGDYFRQMIFDGEVDIDRPALSIAGRIEGMEISPEMHNTLADLQGCKLALLASLRGETEAHFEVSYDPAADERWKFDVTGQLAHGRFEDPRLPHHPLTEIQAKVHIDNRGFSIRDLTARSNQATLSLTCSGGLSTESPMDIDGEIRQLPLDDQLMSVLPGELQRHWHELHPAGVIDAYVQIHFDGRAWRPRVRLHCRNVSFSHDIFRYQLEHGSGALELNDDRLSFDISASSENQPIHLAGEIRNPFTGATGWLRVRCEALPLDKKLWDALRPELQPLAVSLDLRGTAAVDLELSQDVANGPLHQHIRAWPDHCSLCYKDFPVAVSKIVGQAGMVPVEMVDGNWWFRNIEGYNGTSRITGDGRFFCSPKGNELVLRLNAGNVPLDRELREALPTGMGQIWTMLQPRGIIDLTAGVHYLSRGNILDVSVRAEPRSETCSLEPSQFPYRLDNVQGLFTYDGGRLSFERFRASHGLVKLACSGTCSFQPDGGWQLQLDRVTVDRLRLDRQFMQILPEQLKKNLGELNVTGPISLHDGSVVVARAGDPNKPTVARWDFPLGLDQVGVDCGVRLENLSGNVRINGWSDGTRFQMRGELAVESMTCRDLQLTQVMGPFWIDEQKALFGSWVAQQDNQSLPRGQPPVAPRPVVAKIFAGTIYGDGFAFFGEQPQYRVQGRLVDADLATGDLELTGKNHNLHGRILADAELHGTGRTRTGLLGQGSFQLGKANIYELPAMVSLLKIVSIKAPDPNAFSTSNGNFRIEGEHVYFNKLDFNGDAISLSGKGELNFQGDMNVVFRATLGRGDAGIPVIRNLFAGASQQIMQIHGTGNIQDPKFDKEVLPGVNQALKNLQDQ
jgi:hypothetical protein